MALLTVVPNAGALTLTVDSLGDAGDINPGNGQCATAGNACTLRAAIGEANAYTTDAEDVINISVTGDINVGSELQISTPMRIEGPGPEDLAVRRPSGASEYRVFLVQPQSGVIGATISGLRIQGGSCQCQGGGMALGGAVVMTLREVDVAGNLVHSTQAQGGGIWAGSGASLRVIDSTVRNNQATGDPFPPGYQDGGSGVGGGIFAGGTLLMRGSTVAGNSTAGANGKDGAGGGAGGNGGSSFGGGIYGFGGSTGSGGLVIESSTIAGNAALNPGGAGGGTPSGTPGQGRGGGVMVAAGRHDFNGVTFANNNSTHNGGSLFVGYSTNAEAYLESTIMAGSPAFHCDVGPSGPAIISQGFNLVTDNSCGGIAAGPSPQLGLLADNGGPTETMALPKSSPAIDAGLRSASLQSAIGVTVTSDITDQRGLQRPFDFADEPNASGGDGSDIGAFELQTGSGPGTKSISLEAKPKKVKKGDKTTLIATVGPCPDAVGEEVEFQKKAPGGYQPVKTRIAPASCSVSLKQKVAKRVTYRAFSPESPSLSAATSKKVTVDVK